MIIDRRRLAGPLDCYVDLPDDGAVLVPIDPRRGFVAGNTKLLPVKTGSCPVTWCRSDAPEQRWLRGSGCHGRQADGCSIAEGAERFQGHVAPLHGPFVILL